jgi:hypothetical protein
MPLDFPSNPEIGDTYSFGGNTWRWNGYAWENYSTSAGFNYVETLNGLSGTVAIDGGSDIDVSLSGQSIVLSLDQGGLAQDLPIATTGSPGIASFDDNTFTVTATGHVAVKTGIKASQIIVLGESSIFGPGATGALPALDGSALTGVDAKFLQGRTPREITDGGVF